MNVISNGVKGIWGKFNMRKKKNESRGKLGWTKFIGKDVKLVLSLTVASVAVCAVLILLAMFSAPEGPATAYRPHGRIVITSDSKSPDGFVSATFARCRYFLIYDLATKRFKALANPYFNEVGPGASSARFIANRAEEAVISGNIGPVAYQTLENFNIQVYLVHKTSIRDAVRLFLEGRLVHVKPRNQLGFTNVPPRQELEPPERAAIQRAAWNPAFGGAQSSRMAYCPIGGLLMPLGPHIQTNRIMCPYHPGQVMQIMVPSQHQNGIGPYSNQVGQVQGQRVGFGYGGGPATRGVVVLR